MDEFSSSPEKVYTVTEITKQIKSELETRFSQIWVEGEISGFTRAHSGHLYFTLKDQHSQISAVMWKFSAQRIRFDLNNGLQVICRGRINVYEPRGQYQLVAELIEPKGMGALQLAFEQLKEKLHKEGLFDPGLKKKLPVFPKKIGIVTSPKGAAVIDILRTLERRFAKLHILIYPAKVQGQGAAGEIVEGIRYFSSLPDIDVLIVGRGGGSIEDLWAFNEEPVARAIFECPIPVISAVGHEIDFTIADFTADQRAATPTAAAEMVVEKEQAFIEKIGGLEQRLGHKVKLWIQEQRNQVLTLIGRQAFQNFKFKILNLSQRVDDLEIRALNVIRSERQRLAENRAAVNISRERISGAIRTKLQRFNGTWERLAAELDNLSPLNILNKGYALCWKDKDGSFVRRVEDVVPGDDVMVSFFKGRFDCRVKSVAPDFFVESWIKSGRISQQEKLPFAPEKKSEE